MTGVLKRKTGLIGVACILASGAAAFAVGQHAAVADPVPSVSLTPQAVEVNPGDTFDVDVAVDAAGRDLLIFDVAVEHNCDTLSTAPDDVQFVNPLDTANCTQPDCAIGDLATTGLSETNGVGTVRYGAARLPDPVSDVSQSVMHIQFTVDAAASAGDYSIEVSIAGLANNDGVFDDTIMGDCVVTVVTDEFDPWVYDEDTDGVVGKIEALAAVTDYFDGGITKSQALQVISLYFTTSS